MDVQVAAGLGRFTSGHAASGHPEHLLRLGAGGDGEHDLPGQVLTSTSPPRMALKTSMVTWVCRSSPSRSKGGSSATSMTRYRSEGLPSGAGGDRAGMRTFVPVRTPGGMLTSTRRLPTWRVRVVPVKASFRLMVTGCWMAGAAREVRPRRVCPRIAPPKMERKKSEKVPSPNRSSRLTSWLRPPCAGGPAAPVVIAGSAVLLPLGIGLAQLVVAGALLGVAQDLVGLVDLFKAVLGLLVTGVAVRMILHGQFAVGAFDLVSAGATRDAQDLVVIVIFHGTPCCNYILDPGERERSSAGD